MPWKHYIEGHTYSRKDVNRDLNTEKIKGIWPMRGPGGLFVVAFSSEIGLASGYEDRREGDIFLYYGKGPRGDMSFKEHENRAMCECSSVFLFDEPSPNIARFIGEFECNNVRLDVDAYDETYTQQQKKIRKAIVFELSYLLGPDRLKELYPEEKESRCNPGSNWRRIDVDQVRRDKLKGWPGK